MKVDRLTKEYLDRLGLLEKIQKTVGELKDMLIDVIDAEGIPDEKGHRWLTAGDFLLKRQKSGGISRLDPMLAEQWAKDRGIWDEVSVVPPAQLDEDKLVGWVFENRKDEGLEQAFKDACYRETPVVYSFIKPVEGKQYDY